MTKLRDLMANHSFYLGFPGTNFRASDVEMAAEMAIEARMAIGRAVGIGIALIFYNPYPYAVAYLRFTICYSPPPLLNHLQSLRAGLNSSACIPGPWPAPALVESAPTYQ